MYTSFDAQKCLVPKCHSILPAKGTVPQMILGWSDALIATEANRQKLEEVRTKYQRMA